MIDVKDCGFEEMKDARGMIYPAFVYSFHYKGKNWKCATDADLVDFAKDPSKVREDELHALIDELGIPRNKIRIVL